MLFTRCVFPILLLSLLAAGPATRPATTEPWRPSPGHPKAVGLLLPPGIAPCVLHVNALRFPLASGTPLTARYDWDFGDPGSKYNTLTGFNAAHVYEGPGKYTVKLTVTDETGAPRLKPRCTRSRKRSA
jgi:hypothetical protein